MRAGRLTWLVLWCACSTGRYAQSGSSGVKPFRLERYDFYLQNGLRVILEPDHRSPIVALTTIVRAGAADDPAGKAGLAHVTARLTLRAREEAGMTRRQAFLSTAAAEASAQADVDETALTATGPSAKLRRLLELSAAQLGQPVRDVGMNELAAERVQIERERQARIDGGDPAALVPELRRILFEDSQSYARSPDGTTESVNAIEPSDVEAFARTHYRTQNATLAVVGDLDPIEVQNLVAEIYRSAVGTAGAAEADHPPVDLRPPVLPGKAELTTIHANVPTPELVLGWVLPGYYDKTAPLPDLIAAALHRVLIEFQWPPPHNVGIVRQDRSQVAPQAFAPERMAPAGSGRRSSSWMFDPDLVSLSIAPDSRGLLMGQISGLPGPDIDSDIEDVEAFAVPGVHATILVCRVKLREGAHPSDTLENVLDHLRMLWEGKVREALFLTRPGLFSRVVLESESPAARSRLIASYASFVGGSQALSKTLDRLLMPAASIEHFAWNRLTRELMRALVVLPRPDAAHPQMPAWALKTDNRPTATDAPTGLGIPPGVRAIDPDRVRSVVLKNGLEVITVQRRGIPVVTVSALLRVGTGSGRPPGVVDAALRITRPGRRFGNPADFGIVELLDARPDAITFEQQGGAEHLGKMLAILSDRIKTVSAMKSDLDIFRKYTIPEWRREEFRPRAQADREFWKALFGDHSYGFRAVAADLAKVTLGDVERWIRRTYRPENIVLVMAGDLDPDEAQRTARYWLEDWKNDTPLPEGEVSMTPQNEGAIEGSRVIVTRQAGSRVAEIRMGCLLPDSVHERDIVAYDLASELIAGRLARNLEPGVAGGIANESGRLLGGTTALAVSAVAGGSAAVDVVRELREGLDGLAASGPSAAELDEARWSLARRHVLSVASTPDTVHAVLETRKRGLPVTSFNHYAARLVVTTAEQVQAAFQACRERNVLSLLADEPLASAAAAEWKRP